MEGSALPMPRAGTFMPAAPSLFVVEGIVAGCRDCDIAAVYGGGGLVAGSGGGSEACRGGNRGGRVGLCAAFVPSVEDLVGGSGSPFVLSPDLSALYGNDGAEGFSAACSCPFHSAWFPWGSSAIRGTPSPRRSGVVLFGEAAPPW